ncbi:DUF1015 domain-containing protein [Chitinispirillales bacterium ANBcel5]|uniref:DUF1015 domain-containing protein n=1 Tax=Cellulosispirillum alkaliphilum TaxID=3039283 RepID=UPI002A5841E5|nr:DUF1015 domain-containing protein [Chitinispirillales bacterium ANBcel5]
MAGVRAFRGYRYNLRNQEELGLYCAPPYDMIDSELVEKLYQKNEYNAVRIIQNKKEQSDKENKDRHLRAAQTLNKLISQGVLKQDQQESVYIYQQNFVVNEGGIEKVKVRTGITVMVELVDFEKQVVFPHEYTLSGPKQDRYELLDATKTNTGQIFGLVPDQGDLFSLIAEVSERAEVCGEFNDESGVTHRLLRSSDSELISRVKDAMADRTILIADGHHRYETALRFYRDQGKEAYSHTMMTLVSMADPGLVIRPFHRLVRKKHSGKSVEMKKALQEYFDVTELGKAESGIVVEKLNQDSNKKMLYWDCDSSQLSELSLNEKGESFLKEFMTDKTSLWKHLDVSVINAIVINRILQLPLDGHILHDVVDYVKDANTAVENLNNEGEYYGGFFIKPMSIDTINEIVKGGERMPQKSTNFFPKLYSGLVFNRMENS